MVFSLPEAIDNWTDLIKKNHETEASKSMRETANNILESTRTLKKQFDNIKYDASCVIYLTSCKRLTFAHSEQQVESVLV